LKNSQKYPFDDGRIHLRTIVSIQTMNTWIHLMDTPGGLGCARARQAMPERGTQDRVHRLFHVLLTITGSRQPLHALVAKVPGRIMLIASFGTVLSSMESFTHYVWERDDGFGCLASRQDVLAVP
jgi:hypothetical protein